MSVDVLGYLQSKGLQMKHAGGDEYHTHCFWHGEDTSKRGRLYINCNPNADIPGLYECKVCDAHGALATIKKHFGDYDEDQETDDNSETKLEIFRIAAQYYHDQLADYPEVLKYLKGSERMLTLETIIEQKIGYASDELVQDVATGQEKWVPSRALYHHLRDMGYSAEDIIATGLVTENRKKQLVDSLSGMVTIPYMVAGNIVAIRGRAWPYDSNSKRPKYKTCGGSKARLFNSDVTWHHDEVVVTEGEFDALILQQMGYPAVGVPGANTWQDGWDAYLKDKRRIWLVFDRDPAGETGTQKMMERFGTKARRIALSPENVKCDPTQWVAQGHTAQDFQQLLDLAQKGGLLVTVDEAISEHAEVQAATGIKFGFDLLDTAINPGLLPGQVAVVLAKTGTGKTIFLLNMMHRMAMQPSQDDLKMLFISLEQTRGEWWERARRIFRFYNLDATDADAADFWRDRLMIVDKNRLSEDDVKQIIEDFDYRVGHPPDLISLDYLGYWSQSFRGDRYQRTSDAIMSIKGLAKDVMIPIVTPHQVSRMAKDGEEFGSDAARDAGVVEETADFLFAIWSPDNNMGRTEDEKQGVINMKILKSRHGSRGLKLNFYWAPLSLVMIPQGDKLVHLARDELVYASPGYRDTWETAVWRHQTGMKGPTQRPGNVTTQTDLDARRGL